MTADHSLDDATTETPIAGGYVRVFDTTLRDGEQSPGATLTADEKLEVAAALARLGVDVMEAGFPAASPDDLRAVQRIAQTVGQQVLREGAAEPVVVCGLARAVRSDIDRAHEAVRHAARPRIHTFLATSPIHRVHKLRLSRAQVLERVREMVSYARELCDDVEFSPEDAGRTEEDFLAEVLALAIESGASTLNIPDTVGFTMPHEFGTLIASLVNKVPNIERAVLSVHCHNDLGLATANTLAGVANGARQVEVTVNGIGERAGNTALEEVVMALRTRQTLFGLETGIDTTQISRTSRLVSARTGMVVQPNKAIVGANAFAHEAGIHQDGVLKNEETYEIMRPETVGLTRSELVLGKHSGRHALGARLQELGHVLSDRELGAVFARFKEVADRKKAMTDADVEALLSEELYQPEARFTLDAMQVGAGTMGMPTATVRVRRTDGSTETQAAVGTGPVDATFKAIDAIVAAPVELLEYTVHSVTEGIDALGEVSVRLRPIGGEGRLNPQRGSTRARGVHGHGTDTDVLVASAKAYLAAINRFMSHAARTEDGEHAAASASEETELTSLSPTESTTPSPPLQGP